MATVVHFIDVGQGSMVLIEADLGRNFLYDCNVTKENETGVLSYVESVVSRYGVIDAFICSHRDTDHIRGIERVDTAFPILEIWDNNYPLIPTWTNSDLEYLDLRDEVRHRVIKSKKYCDIGNTRFRFLSSRNRLIPENSNSQGIVMKIEHLDKQGHIQGSVILAGDSDVSTWKYGIMLDYSEKALDADVLMAPHHGSNTAFVDTNDRDEIYTDHIEAIKPFWTIISSDGQRYGHPHKLALKLYKRFSLGLLSGTKIGRTDRLGTMSYNLKDLSWKQGFRRR